MGQTDEAVVFLKLPRTVIQRKGGQPSESCIIIIIITATVTEDATADSSEHSQTVHSFLSLAGGTFVSSEELNKKTQHVWTTTHDWRRTQARTQAPHAGAHAARNHTQMLGISAG